MSMNLHIEATRKAFSFNGKGKKVSFNDRRSFDCWQTPTEVTKNILSQKTQDEKVQAYVTWAESISKPYEDNIYDYEAGLNANLEYPVIGRKMVNPSEDHAKELQDFLNECHEEGFTINFHMM